MFEIGNSLREARLRQSLDFTEAELATKIRARYLRALEEEQFDVLPAQTYVKGFLRAYAEYLGLDGQLYVDEYNSRYVAGEEEPPVRPRQSAVRPRGSRRIESSVILIALAAIALVTALVIAAWKFGGANTGDQAIPNLAKQRSGVAAQHHTRVKRHSRPARPHPALARLLVRASGGSCWLSVHAGSGTGRPLYEGTLEDGQRQRFVARRLWVDAGAPDNVKATLNGKPVSLGHGSGIVIVTAKGVSGPNAAA